jgi:hypothetical protein
LGPVCEEPSYDDKTFATGDQDASLVRTLSTKSGGKAAKASKQAVALSTGAKPPVVPSARVMAQRATKAGSDARRARKKAKAVINKIEERRAGLDALLADLRQSGERTRQDLSQAQALLAALNDDRTAAMTSQQAAASQEAEAHAAIRASRILRDMQRAGAKASERRRRSSRKRKNKK